MDKSAWNWLLEIFNLPCSKTLLRMVDVVVLLEGRVVKKGLLRMRQVVVVNVEVFFYSHQFFFLNVRV